MFAVGWKLGSTTSSASSVVLTVLRADRRRGLAMIDRARGLTGCDVIATLSLKYHRFVLGVRTKVYPNFL
jgi:hypothetical protein